MGLARIDVDAVGVMPPEEPGVWVRLYVGVGPQEDDGDADRHLEAQAREP